MKKKWIVVCIAAVMAFSLTACGAPVPYSDYDLSEYIEVGEYKGLEVEKVDTSVTDEMVEEEIDYRLQMEATTEVVEEGTVEEGDTVIINYVGKMDGEAFEGGTADNYELTIGSGQFIDGFESGLIGKEVGGDPVVLNLKFPDPYPNNHDLAGKDVEFTVTIVSKQVQDVPELDEDFLDAVDSDAKTVEEYKKEVRAELEETQKENGIEMQKQMLWNTLMDNSTVLTDDDGNEKYPQEELDRVYDEMLGEYQEYADQSGMELADLIEEQTGLTEDEFKDEIKEYAKSVVKQELVLYTIVEKEEIKISKSEYDEYIEESLASMDMTDDNFESAYGESFEDYYGEDMIRRNIYLDKVMDLMLDNAKEVDQLTEDTEEGEEAHDHDHEGEEAEDAADTEESTDAGESETTDTEDAEDAAE